ncbi:magnesium transporter MgtC [Lactococcus hodotermopsidis]|uniref:Magnesium transporter MgtC n=1 Tax=Pseudolactococcus hodotermopsidis TaxID=2709157 RepID=A0A6A0B8A0_9LACT|nr:magnesium transporter MgtC [Lactococcus hodotermopsidis]
METQEVIFRLVIAILLSGFIGFDREYKNRPAGIRTYILVCVGATIIAMTQTQLNLNTIAFAQAHPDLIGILQADASRLTAQVVSGIGFLGAGTIIVTKDKSILGLTTAASLWAVAGVGIAIGMGFYLISIIGTMTILAVLTFLKKLIKIPTLKKIELRFVHKQETKTYIANYFEAQKIKIEDVAFKVDIHNNRRIYTNLYQIELPMGLSYSDIVEDFSYHDNMVRVRLLEV